MTNDPAPAQLTVDFRGDPPSGTSAPRVRVALVAGSDAPQGHDLYVLLLGRLRVFTSIFAVGLCVFFALPLPFVWHAIQSGQINEPGALSHVQLMLTLRGVPLLAAAGAAVLLWRRPPSSLAGLRTVELLVVGVFAAILVIDGVGTYQKRLEPHAREPQPLWGLAAVAYANVNALYWFSLLVMYGTLLPNTWRRSLAVVGILGLCPLVMFAVLGLWLRPIPANVFGYVLTDLTYNIAVAVALAVFSSSRVEILRQQAVEARKLGQYVLRERLGSGGMGEVYRAEHALLRRPCAIKVIRPERAGDAKTLRRFEREVQTTATLTHPNTVQIYDYGRADDGTFYYVMEYLPGPTLDELVRREGPLPPARAIHFLRQICGALREAHRRGLIHRDVKPGNVIICERGDVPDVAKLLDFGLVLPPVGDADGDRLTQDGTITGTPAYLSPEQAAGQEADARSDVYSVGALAYFLLTGRPPFAHRIGVHLVAAHLYEPPEPPSQHRPGIPAGMEVVVLRCLAKEPAARFPDVASLDEALAACHPVGHGGGLGQSAEKESGGADERHQLDP